jgi:transcriptional regulator of NAD metabolism
VGDDFKKAVRQVPEKEWKRIYKKTPQGRLLETKQECAEVVYVPNSLCKSKNSPEYRFVATREECIISDKASRKLVRDILQRELELDIEEAEQKNENLKKLHMTCMNGRVYKVYGIVTNMLEMEASELVLLHHKRCGKSEEIHSILKDDLAGGHVISKRFGANAAYWNIAVLASSLHNVLKNNFLPEKCGKSRPKTLIFLFYAMAGQIVRHARKKILKVFGSRTGRSWFTESLQRMEVCFNAT